MIKFQVELMKKQINYSDSETFVKAAALGASAGLRTFTAPALLGFFASRGEKNEFENNLLASPKIAAAVGLLAAGELVGDKLPATPNRTETPGLIARIISGAFVGGSLCAARKKNIRTGIAVGALSAVAAAYAGENIRREIAARTGIPSAALGAVEDAIAIGVGIKALQNK